MSEEQTESPVSFGDGNERKTHKITELEHQKLRALEVRETQNYKDQAKRLRENQLRHLSLEIVRTEREIAFKEEELRSGIIEKHADFADGNKPRFFVENDIDTLKLAIEDYKMQIEDVKKTVEEDK